jgi:hypothetical protein
MKIPSSIRVYPAKSVVPPTQNLPEGPSKSVSICVHLWFLHAEPAGRPLPFAFIRVHSWFL